MSQQSPTMLQPVRIPLAIVPENRGPTTAKDSKLINCYIETDKEKNLWIYKRPGFVEYSSVTAGVGLGCFNWRGHIYSIVDSTIYKDTLALTPALSSTGASYSFSMILGASPKMVYGDGTYAYATDGTVRGTALNTYANFLTPFLPGIVYLNGASYFFTHGSFVFGSAPNDITTWDPLDAVKSQIEPDFGVALDKQIVYVIAFNQWSTEVFYDAGNAIGSPLGNVQGSKVGFGCAAGMSVQRIEDKLIWMSATRSGTFQIAKMEFLLAKIISTAPVNRLLRGVNVGDNNPPLVYSWQLKLNEHTFYVLTLKDKNLTLVYDLLEDTWCQWTDTDGNYLPFTSSTYIGSGVNLVQHESNGKIYSISDEYTNDDGDMITVDIITPNWDAGMRKNKTLDMLDIIADQQEGSVLQVRNSDDDYQTWTNFEQRSLTDERVYLDNCGTFRKRAYHLRHQSDTAFRIMALEATFDIGVL